MFFIHRKDKDCWLKFSKLPIIFYQLAPTGYRRGRVICGAISVVWFQFMSKVKSLFFCWVMFRSFHRYVQVFRLFCSSFHCLCSGLSIFMRMLNSLPESRRRRLPQLSPSQDKGWNIIYLWEFLDIDRNLLGIVALLHQDCEQWQTRIFIKLHCHNLKHFIMNSPYQ